MLSLGTHCSSLLSSVYSNLTHPSEFSWRTLLLEMVLSLSKPLLHQVKSMWLGRLDVLHLLSTFRRLAVTAYITELRQTLMQQVATVAKGGHGDWCWTVSGQEGQGSPPDKLRPCLLGINRAWQTNYAFLKHREHILHFLFLSIFVFCYCFCISILPGSIRNLGTKTPNKYCRMNAVIC